MELLINLWQRTFEGGWQTITRQIKIWKKSEKGVINKFIATNL
ncbi:hypothetical protein [Okeania sp. SIO3I5]|nr:hypothetical protein [Okeania sp. SIO3I5]